MLPAVPHQRIQLSNPFATRYTRPGAVPYLFSDASSIALLVDQLATLLWHGNRRPPRLRQNYLAGATAARVYAARTPSAAVHATRRAAQLPPGVGTIWQPETLVVVDGYEQLSWWSRRCLTWSCHRCQCGLLVTSHGRVGLPVLHRTSADLERVQRIVAHLTTSAASPVTPADVRAAFQMQQDNVREILFTLYDVHQSRT